MVLCALRCSPIDSSKTPNYSTKNQYQKVPIVRTHVKNSQNEALDFLIRKVTRIQPQTVQFLSLEFGARIMTPRPHHQSHTMSSAAAPTKHTPSFFQKDNTNAAEIAGVGCRASTRQSSTLRSSLTPLVKATYAALLPRGKRRALRTPRRSIGCVCSSLPKRRPRVRLSNLSRSRRCGARHFISAQHAE